MARQIRFYGKLDLDIPPVCSEPEPTPTPSPSQEPEFIKVCGFEPSMFISGTYSYWGTDDNGYAVWQNLNSYELKFDVPNNSYVLGVIDNPYEYYLFGTTSPIGSTWKNTSDESVAGASTVIDTSPFEPCP